MPIAYIERGVTGVNPSDGKPIYASFTAFQAASGGLGAGAVFVRDTGGAFTTDFDLTLGANSQQFYPDPANAGQVTINFSAGGAVDGFLLGSGYVGFLGDNRGIGGTQARGFRFVGGGAAKYAIIGAYIGNTVRDCDFEQYQGGALQLKNGASQVAQRLRCKSTVSTGAGGAIATGGGAGTGTVHSCLIIGGVRGATVGSAYSFSKVSVVGATGAGFYVQNGGFVRSSWSILCGKGFERLSGAGTVSFCATQTPAPNDYVGGNSGNCQTLLLADFAFLDPASDDYRIGPASLCKDTGTNASAPALDYFGTAVPQDGTCDIGYHEFYDPDPPAIVHVPIADGAITGTATDVDATITDASGVGSATLYHRRKGVSAWTSVAMANIGGDVYRGTIPGAAIPEGTVEYYIRAEDTLAPPNAGTDPAGAPGAFYSFGCAPLTAMDSVEVLGHNRLRVTFTEKFGASSVFDGAGWSVLRRSGPTPENVVGVAITGDKVVEVYVNGGIVAPMSYTVACPGSANPYGLPATLAILAFTVTPSMVASVFASAALADQFGAMPAESDVPDCLIYPMLPEGLRTIDQSSGALLERLLWGAETEWAAFMQRAWRLRHLSDYKVVPEQLLDYLLALVGFGTGEPGRLARLLTEADKRRLVSVAARYWQRRGRLDALSDVIRVFASGIRPAIDPYPALRFIVDEVEMGMTGHPGLDPWVLALPTAMDTVYLRVPDLGSLDRGIVESLARLARPMGEVYEIAYVDFLDAFTDGIQGHWEKRGSVVTTWREPYLSPDPLATPHRLPGLRLLAGCAERVAVPLGPTWAEYVWGAYVEWEGTGNDATLALRFYVTDDDNRYEVRFLPTGVVQFIKRVAGLNTLILATAIPPGLDRQHGICIETEVNLAGNNEVRVYLDGALVLLDATDNAHSAGTVEVAVTAGTGAVVFSRTELYRLPLATTTLTG